MDLKGFTAQVVCGVYNEKGESIPFGTEIPAHEFDIWTKLDRSQTIRKWKKSQYDKSRDYVRSGKRINDRPRKGGHFVAVDSEGLNIGRPFFRDGNKYQKQRSCLWMAGGAEGFEDQSISDADGRLSSVDIFGFLLSLPRKFAAKSPDAPAPIFVSFSFSYDIAQIIADMPYEKAWELHHGKPWDRRNDKDCEPNYRRWVLWKGYAISCIPRKSVTLCRLTDPDNVFRRRQRDGNDYVSWKSGKTNGSKSMTHSGFFSLGSGLIDHSQKMTAAAMQIAEK